MPDTTDIPDSLLQATLAQLKRHAPFDQMTAGHLAFMARRLRLTYHPKGDIILRPEQGASQALCIIKQGIVTGEQGKSETAHLQLLEGECFPLGALLANRPVACVYRAELDTFLYELPADAFTELLRISQPFHDFCTRRIANLLDQSQRSMQASYSNLSSARQSLDTPLASLIRQQPVIASPQTPIKTVLRTLHEMNIGSMIVVEDEQPVGIFTLHDLLERVALPGVDASQPISTVMSTNPVTLPAHSFAHEAALAMANHGIRHVLVMANDKLAGIISEKDLFSLQRIGLTEISGNIHQAKTIEMLQQCSRDIQTLGHNMLAQGVRPEHLTQFISTLNDLLTSRIIDLEMGGLPADQKQLVQHHACWLAFGSEGRLEQTLNTDQDNGIIFDVPEGKTADGMRDVFLPFARRINEALDKCGFPLCKGEIMASNSKWCLSFAEWQDAFADWIDHGDPQALLHATIFFDFRPLFGKAVLAEKLRQWLAEVARKNTRFLHQMAANALRNRPPLGLVRDFAVGDDDTLDLKLNGISPFIDAARIFSLATGVVQTGTLQRLRLSAETLAIPPKEIEGWGEAFLFIQLLRLRLHHKQIEAGLPMSNRADPEQLNELDRRILKEAFRQARKLQSRLALNYNL